MGGKTLRYDWVMDLGYDAQVIYQEVGFIYGSQAIFPSIRGPEK